MYRTPFVTSPRNALRALAAASLFALAASAHAAPPPFASFTAIGNASNYSSPGVWEHNQMNVTAFVAGASSATLSFDIANDLPGTGSTSTNLPTNAHLYFASEAGSYFMNFEYFLLGEFGTPTYGNSPLAAGYKVHRIGIPSASASGATNAPNS